jgi:hypothetical protein
MTGRERVKNAINFQGIDRLPRDFPERYGTDIFRCTMDPDPDPILNMDLNIKSWYDEWGTRWERVGRTTLGEPKNVVLADWKDLDALNVPVVDTPERLASIEHVRSDAGEKYLLCRGISLYFRASFLRGQENIWLDIYENTEQLCQLIDILVAMNLKALSIFKDVGADGFHLSDDWGLQDSLQIHPDKWREIWKPRYAVVFAAAHEAGLDTSLHSCGNIVSIMDDLIEIGLDMINMDQQENMGLDLLENRFRGRIAFYNPVDIQNTMVTGSADDIRRYCRSMVRAFNTDKGGFIPKWYVDPEAAGHSQEAIDTMCEEFIKISMEIYGE